jgi:hypothetical protein
MGREPPPRKALALQISFSPRRLAWPLRPMMM